MILFTCVYCRLKTRALLDSPQDGLTIIERVRREPAGYGPFGHESSPYPTSSVSAEWSCFVAFALAAPALPHLTSTRSYVALFVTVILLALIFQWLVFTHE
jgi:hypothetical protein